MNLTTAVLLCNCGLFNQYEYFADIWPSAKFNELKMIFYPDVI